MLWADCCRWPRSNNGERALLLSRSCSSSSRGRSRLGIEPRSVDRLVAHRTVRASVGTYGLLEDDTLASVGALPLRFDTVVASRLLLVAFDTPLSTSLVICQTLSASLYSNQLCRVLQRGLGLRKKKKKGGGHTQTSRLRTLLYGSLLGPVIFPIVRTTRLFRAPSGCIFIGTHCLDLRSGGIHALSGQELFYQTGQEHGPGDWGSPALCLAVRPLEAEKPNSLVAELLRQAAVACWLDLA